MFIRIKPVVNKLKKNFPRNRAFEVCLIALSSVFFVKFIWVVLRFTISTFTISNVLATRKAIFF